MYDGGDHSLAMREQTVDFSDIHSTSYSLNSRRSLKMGLKSVNSDECSQSGEKTDEKNIEEMSRMTCQKVGFLSYH